MKEAFQIMSLSQGHETIHFDPDDEKDVKSIRKRLKDLLDKGYYAYIMKVNGEYETLQPKNIKNITDADITKFILAKKKKMVATNPKTGG